MQQQSRMDRRATPARVVPRHYIAFMLDDSRAFALVVSEAVIAVGDAVELAQPKAVVVLKPGIASNHDLDVELERLVKDSLAPDKYPRWIEFIGELPKTGTGKIQRFKLRQRESQRKSA